MKAHRNWRRESIWKGGRFYEEKSCQSNSPSAHSRNARWHWYHCSSFWCRAESGWNLSGSERRNPWVRLLYHVHAERWGPPDQWFHQIYGREDRYQNELPDRWPWRLERQTEPDAAVQRLPGCDSGRISGPCKIWCKRGYDHSSGWLSDRGERSELLKDDGALRSGYDKRGWRKDLFPGWYQCLLPLPVW